MADVKPILAELFDQGLVTEDGMVVDLVYEDAPSTSLSTPDPPAPASQIVPSVGGDQGTVNNDDKVKSERGIEALASNAPTEFGVANASGKFFYSCRQAIAGYQATLRSRVGQFFAEAGPGLAALRSVKIARNRVEASAFDLFEWIKPDENCLSDIFADLLDPLVGTHGQGTVFLEELLRMAGVPWVEGLDQAEAWREDETWLIDKSLRRIDISVHFPHLKFGIGIENKPWASDQVDQVADYVRHMELPFGKHFLFFYWSGHGGAPTSLTQEKRQSLERQGRLHVWSYQRELRKWLETSRQACQVKKVDWFLTDLLNYLGRTFVEVSRPSQEEP